MGTAGVYVRVALLWMAGCGVGMAQPAAEQPALRLSARDAHVAEHMLGPVTAVHLSDEEYRGLRPGAEYIEFEITVSANGRVDSARVTGRSLPHQDEAQSLEMERLFKPWTQDGAPIRVIVNDYVSLLPPEEWSEVHTPFPHPWTLQGARIQLTRTRCFGTCPDYEVTIAGDGTVEFNGRAYVLIPGHHVAHVPTQSVKELIGAFDKADFFSANDRYAANWTDNPTQTLTITVAGRTKTVIDYVGTSAGMPLALRNLEASVDEVAGTARWVKGNEATENALRDEHWPFAAATRENVALYNSAIAGKNKPLIEQYLAMGGPIVATGDQFTSPVCAASRAGNLDLVQRMLAPLKKSPLPSRVLNQCLLAAARSGNPEMLVYWIEKGADPTAQPVKSEEPTSGWSVLANGVLSGNAAVVKMLLENKVDVQAPTSCGDPCPVLTFALQRGEPQSAEIAKLLIAAGADVNARGQLGETPLFAASSTPKAVDLLISAGADLEARNDQGSTALIRYGFMEPTVRALLAAGADPTLMNKRGETALTTAKQYGCPACATLIEAALKKRATSSATSPPAP
jgi:ankyrin repeat protein